MSAQPLDLYSALLPEGRAELLARALDGLEGAALHWISGYAAGLAVERSALRAQLAATSPLAPAREITPAREAATEQRLTIVYGTQTGNSRRVAEQLQRRVDGAGFAVRLLRADAYPLRELAQERLLYLVISTQGDGDPPDDARGFVEFVLSRRAPRLEHLKFAVLGLGDSSYPQFCAIGRRIDARLAELGAARIAERADADLDLDAVAGPWQERAFSAARDLLRASLPRATVTPLFPVAAASSWSRERPFAAEILANQRITGRGAGKDVRHLELSLADAGLNYEPGDSLGIQPTNSPALVDAVLDALKLDGGVAITRAGETRALSDWLANRRELTRLSRPFLAAQAERAGSDALRAVLADTSGASLSDYFAQRQVLDVLREARATWEPDALVAALPPLLPRLYSIASSRKSVGDEAHLTVALIRDEDPAATRWGAASQFVAAHGEGDRLPVFLEPNERFRLPRDATRDLIMIGPGTGVAPFRAFLQERAALGASGRHWLFFGNPHFRSDFLYQTEWQQALKDGTLHRLELAFSRDQAEKDYVQHRLEQNGRELHEWLEGGAHLYVCGDARRMAKDVHAALIRIIATHGAVDEERAAERLNELQQEGRYARDVY